MIEMLRSLNDVSGSGVQTPGFVVSNFVHTCHG
ncbi:hypothetical protein CSUI_009135 [Cystoisospora suis]|uniref:Uncharacterized protein n=1 Tax=Cystoisospora suis TaxID=483139 RepID=A0A2C6KKP0_9APIC|nr:hypothetical protein CSUI_009135 [Cystoisospora suis]